MNNNPTLNEREICDEYKNTRIGAESLGRKYGVGKDKINEILNKNNIPSKKKGGQPLYTSYLLENHNIEKYPRVEGKHYIAVDRNTGYTVEDYMNRGGFLTSHIRKSYNVEIPPLRKRNDYYRLTGNYWWEQWFDIKLVEDKVEKKCPYCDWATNEPGNRRHYYERHLLKEHGLTREEHLKRHPEDLEYFKMGDLHDGLKKETDTNKFVVCKICGEKMAKISGNHIRHHNMTIEEYINKFGDGEIICNDFKEKMKKNAKVMNEWNKEHKNDSRSITRRNHFIERAKIIHRGENLDYSMSDYVNDTTPLLIIDHDLREDGTEYGEYWMSPSEHLRGCVHPDKKADRRKEILKRRGEDFIRRAMEVHNDPNLDYSEVVFEDYHKPVKIIDHTIGYDGKEYGAFWQEPSVHLQGCKCKRRGYDKNKGKLCYAEEEFREKCRELYKDMNWDFSHTVYRGMHETVDVFCNKIGQNGRPHGMFHPYAQNLLNGTGCPKCSNNMSYDEEAVRVFIEQIVGEENVVKQTRTVLKNRYELDIYVPSYKIAIEYNGLIWHSEKKNKGRNYHLSKTKECREKGIRLYHIFEDEYCNNKEIVLSIISKIFNHYNGMNVINASECETKDISYKECRDFAEENSLFKTLRKRTFLGFYYNGQLVYSVQFKFSDNGSILIDCVTENKEYVVKHIFEKVISYLKCNYNFNSIVFLLDRRWHSDLNDDEITSSGFRLEKYTSPRHCYTNGHNTRLKRLPKNNEKDDFYKIWDCGSLKYVYENI